MVCQQGCQVLSDRARAAPTMSGWPMAAMLRSKVLYVNSSSRNVPETGAADAEVLPLSASVSGMGDDCQHKYQHGIRMSASSLVPTLSSVEHVPTEGNVAQDDAAGAQRDVGDGREAEVEAIADGKAHSAVLVGFHQVGWHGLTRDDEMRQARTSEDKR